LYACLHNVNQLERCNVVADFIAPHIADQQLASPAAAAAAAAAAVFPMHLCSKQVVNQPGLEDVFADLLEYEDRTGEELGAELYMEHCPAHLEGEIVDWMT
jgi:hypothetical protein